MKQTFRFCFITRNFICPDNEFSEFLYKLSAVFNKKLILAKHL